MEVTVFFIFYTSPGSYLQCSVVCHLQVAAWQKRDHKKKWRRHTAVTPPALKKVISSFSGLKPWNNRTRSILLSLLLKMLWCIRNTVISWRGRWWREIISPSRTVSRQTSYTHNVLWYDFMVQLANTLATPYNVLKVRGLSLLLRISVVVASLSELPH